jgi:hypothetical protein
VCPSRRARGSRFPLEPTRGCPRDHAAALSRRLGEEPKYVDRDPHGAEEQSAYEKHCEKLSRSERPVPTPRSATEAP